MTNKALQPDSVYRRWLARVLWIFASFLFFYLLFFDPGNLHPADSWLQNRLHYRVGRAEPTAMAAAKELWTCPMHPDILEEEPGTCPICGMDLVAMTTEDHGSTAQPSTRAREREILFYRNPMNPEITSPVPAKDEMGMDYVPVYSDPVGSSRGEGTTVTIDPTVVQQMNVQTALVERRDLDQEIRSVGYLEFDQERMVSVTTKYSGWVEKVYVNYVGEPVQKGQPMFEIYSPELVQTARELLSALDYAAKFDSTSTEAGQRARALVEAARERLAYWDVSAEQVESLERTGEVFRTLQVLAPASGLVMKRIDGLEGMAIRPGMEVYHIAGLGSLWLSVQVFENQVASIEVGTPAEVEFSYAPGRTFRGKVRYIEPEFSEATRTLQVKIAVPNPEGRLKAGMFGTVRFHPTAARQALVVPTQSVLRTGQRNVVLLDLGGGRFAPREVQLGHEVEGSIEILEGLQEGDRVVTSSQFLIDSESSLQAAMQKMIAQRSTEQDH